MTTFSRRIIVPLVAVWLTALACTCGALSSLTESAEGLDEISEQQQPASEGGGEAELVDACALLTQAEIDDLHGEPLTFVGGGPGGGSWECTYQSDSSSLFTIIQVTPHADASAAQQGFDAGKQLNNQVEDAPGPWTEGYWGADGALRVLHDRYIITAGVTDPVNLVETEDIAIQLATILTERLP